MIILLFHLFFDRKWSLVSCKRSIRYYVRYTLWWLKIIKYKSSRIRFKDLWEIYEANIYDSYIILYLSYFKFYLLLYFSKLKKLEI